MTRPTEAERRAEAERALRRAGEHDSIGGTAMGRAARQPAAAEETAIERLGRRIGRGLAILAMPFVVFWFGRQAGWW